MDDLISKLTEEVLELQGRLEVKEDIIASLEGDLALADAKIDSLENKLFLLKNSGE